MSTSRPNENATPISRNRKARARLGLRSVATMGYLWVTVDRYLTRAARSAGLRSLPKVVGMTPLGKPFSTNAPGSTIDCLMKAASRDARTLSRSGPTVPEAPASLSVWHDEQPLEAKTCWPAAVAALVPPPPAAPPPTAAPARDCLAIQTANSRWGSTCAVWRMKACPRPHSSAQTTG